MTMKGTDGSKQKVALITGASSGIGEATADRLSSAGLKVYGTSRRKGQLGPRSFEMIALDVTDDASVDAAIVEVLRREGRIDVLVNNAGFGVAPAAAEESSIQQAQSIFDTNFFGVLRMTRAVLPHMRRQGSGRIINIGSVLGFQPMPFSALYCATKHALEAYSEATDHEVRSSGVRVVVIEPGFTKTRFDANLLEPDAKLDEYQDIRAHLNRMLPRQIEKGVDPAVVANVVLRAATEARPRVRYTAGAAAAGLSVLRRAAPPRLLEFAIQKGLDPKALEKMSGAARPSSEPRTLTR